MEGNLNKDFPPNVCTSWT